MPPTDITVSASVLALALGALVLRQAAQAWRRANNPIDFAMVLAAGAWICHVLLLTVMQIMGASDEATSIAGQIGVQVVSICVSGLLGTSVGVADRRIYAFLATHLLLGAAALAWHLEHPFPEHQPAYRIWVFVNIVGTGGLLAVLVGATRQAGLHVAFPAIPAATFAVALWIDGLSPLQEQVIPVTFTHLGFAILILGVWQLTRWRSTDGLSGASGFSFSDSEATDGFAPSFSSVADAVAHERRRISQDLHDNLGGQIVNIIAALDPCRSPEASAFSVALERCLLELKITVDAIDSATDNAPEVLGRLRERLQRSFDVLGIKLIWQVESCSQTEAIKGPAAIHILRIAQECLTNIIRHSGATTALVDCRYHPDSNSVLIEWWDNGRGIHQEATLSRGGKGLRNMRRRARTLGGTVTVRSRPGFGTRVRLTLPCSPKLVLTPRIERATTAVLFQG